MEAVGTTLATTETCPGHLAPADRMSIEKLIQHGVFIFVGVCLREFLDPATERFAQKLTPAQKPDCQNEFAQKLGTMRRHRPEQPF
jgi:hypothetical protein